MTTIKLELPENNATALYHFGEALRNIAISDGFVTTVTPTEAEFTKSGPFNVNQFEEHDDNSSASVDQITEAEINAGNIETPIEEHDSEPAVRMEGVTPNGDVVVEPSTELPWDSRIHSRGKTRNANDTWRNARCPKGKTPEEWVEYIKQVEAELTELMSIPVATGPFYWAHSESDSYGSVLTRVELDSFLTEPLCQELTKQEYDKLAKIDADELPPIVTPPIADELPPIADELPPIVTPPIADELPPIADELPPIATPDIVTPPIATPDIVTPLAASDAPETFGQLMKFITTNGKTLNNDIVKAVLAENNLASIALLAARTDLIPQVHKALLGKL
jgi:hypothetical protein